MNTTKTHKCVLCGGKALDEDHCHGCNTYTCSKCDTGNPNMPRVHRPEDHARKWCGECGQYEDNCVCERD